MKHPISDDIRQIAERLIEAAGSKAAARRAIDAAERQGRAGRPKGSSPNLGADSELLFLVESAQNEYRHGALRGKREPSRRALIKRAVEAHDEVFAPTRLGSRESSIVERVAGRSSLAVATLEAMRQHRADLLEGLPQEIEARLRSMADDPKKPNFATVLTLLRFLWAIVRRDPARFKALTADDAAAAQWVTLLTQIEVDPIVLLHPEKWEGD